ncbi:hypothetical protein BJY01DRAFT_221849 [Aspergillus pseudoustus]|uniref:Uncharacterized protein n=1 Tax=Aspergillus pseudoustus TaxID=1810923 RepID=A0ABR4J9C3_9EURO
MISAFGTPTLLLCGRDEGISDPLHNLTVFSGSFVSMTLEMLGILVVRISSMTGFGTMLIISKLF